MCDVTLISFINNYTATGIDLGDGALTVKGSNFIDLSTTELAFYQRYIAKFVANNSADSEMLSATISKLVSIEGPWSCLPMWQSLCYSIVIISFKYSWSQIKVSFSFCSAEQKLNQTSIP